LIFFHENEHKNELTIPPTTPIPHIPSIPVFEQSEVLCRVNAMITTPSKGVFTTYNKDPTHSSVSNFKEKRD